MIPGPILGLSYAPCSGTRGWFILAASEVMSRKGEADENDEGIITNDVTTTNKHCNALPYENPHVLTRAHDIRR